MKDIETELKSRVLTLLEQFDETAAGSKESVMVAANVAKLTDSYLKVVKGEDEIFNKDAEREKLHAETRKLKLEADRMENERTEKTFKEWAMQMRPDQVANIIVIIAITGASVSMEKNGHILPDRFIKWGMKLFRNS